MTGPRDDLPPPSVPPAPDFDAAPPEPDLDLAFDAPAPLKTATGTGAPTPWYQGWGSVVAAVLLLVVLAAMVLSRRSAPPPDVQGEAVPAAPPAPVAEPGPLPVVPLAEEMIEALPPPPNVTATRPSFVPDGASVIEVAGRQAAGTVARPAGAWLRVSLAPGVYTFRVSARADTELHLSDVFTELTFNDDTDGLNPVITERLIGGDYYLWLHIHDEAVEATAPFTLTIDGPD